MLGVQIWVQSRALRNILGQGYLCPNRLIELRNYLSDSLGDGLYYDTISPGVERRVGLYPKTTKSICGFQVEKPFAHPETRLCFYL
jgi:hypothetical protein